MLDTSMPWKPVSMPKSCPRMSLTLPWSAHTHAHQPSRYHKTNKDHVATKPSQLHTTNKGRDSVVTCARHTRAPSEPSHCHRTNKVLHTTNKGRDSVVTCARLVREIEHRTRRQRRERVHDRAADVRDVNLPQSYRSTRAQHVHNGRSKGNRSPARATAADVRTVFRRMSAPHRNCIFSPKRVYAAAHTARGMRPCSSPGPYTCSDAATYRSPTLTR
jgi:hypothetical protein